MANNLSLNFFTWNEVGIYLDLPGFLPFWAECVGECVGEGKVPVMSRVALCTCLPHV